MTMGSSYTRSTTVWPTTLLILSTICFWNYFQGIAGVDETFQDISKELNKRISASTSLTTPVAESRSLTTSSTTSPSPTPLPGSLQVNLGYGIYEGYYDGEWKVNSWMGIRYAASTEGKNRWRAPQPPPVINNTIIQATSNAPFCPQAEKSPDFPIDYGGNEDCLFLNVYSPVNATNLPVVVWFHGGGFGLGSIGQFPSTLQKYAHRPFVGVDIQYRLGAFGFLSSTDIHAAGNLNAGLLDQHYALEWVQKHISLFGGDPSNVVIAGQSAGAGSVLFQALAYGGAENTTYFRRALAASPYLPRQDYFSDPFPHAAYMDFANETGCLNSTAGILDCLRNSTTETLQRANAKVSASGPWGTWRFTPVTDGKFLPDRAAKQLYKQAVNGEQIMVGFVANEGPEFVPQNISTASGLRDYVALMYPEMTRADNHRLWSYYPIDYNNSIPLFQTATRGLGKNYNNYTSALLASTFATGYQQLATVIYGEATMICPAHWLADAFSSKPFNYSSSSSSSTSSSQTVLSDKPDGRKSFLYQFSVPAAQHGADLAVIYSQRVDDPDSNIGIDLIKAMQTSWTSFATSEDGNPSISPKLVNGRTRSLGHHSGELLGNWPQWMAINNPSLGNGKGKRNLGRQMANFNQTLGTRVPSVILDVDIFYDIGESLRNAIEFVDADEFEMNRGARCEFWRSIHL